MFLFNRSILVPLAALALTVALVVMDVLVGRAAV